MAIKLMGTLVQMYMPQVVAFNYTKLVNHAQILVQAARNSDHQSQIEETASVRITCGVPLKCKLWN